MSRRDEVEAEIQSRRESNRFISATERNNLARTLAAEIDALRTENERLDRKRLENALAARRYLGKLHEANATLKAAIDRDERFDCLAAENADLRRELDELSREIVAAHFANATMEKLREAVPEDINNRGYSTHDVLRIWHILYPLETDHE
jgi:DNA-directed RNA polymerase specialized sigma54-like protein